jgi:hypothetical protein
MHNNNTISRDNLYIQVLTNYIVHGLLLNAESYSPGQGPKGSLPSNNIILTMSVVVVVVVMMMIMMIRKEREVVKILSESSWLRVGSNDWICDDDQSSA